MSAVAVVALIAALPWEVEPTYHFLLPMISYALVHAFATARPASMPVIFVFLIGIGTDILKSGPLGYWCLIYLTGLLVARMLATPGSGLAGRTLSYVAAATAMGPVAWGVASLYYLQFVDWLPVAVGFGGSCLVFLMAAVLIVPASGPALRLAGATAIT
ncbi:MAG: hypothetical protein RLZ98_1714 [Pseudomonadota bacterium]|jgi:hypothetical protein